jgi:hypothetical protein
MGGTLKLIDGGDDWIKWLNFPSSYLNRQPSQVGLNSSFEPFPGAAMRLSQC